MASMRLICLLLVAAIVADALSGVTAFMDSSSSRMILEQCNVSKMTLIGKKHSLFL